MANFERYVQFDTSGEQVYAYVTIDGVFKRDELAQVNIDAMWVCEEGNTHYHMGHVVVYGEPSSLAAQMDWVVDALRLKLEQERRESCPWDLSEEFRGTKRGEAQ